jgi:hypothetical protein
MPETKGKLDMLAFWVREAPILGISGSIIVRSWEKHSIQEMIFGIALLLALSISNYGWTRYQTSG